MISSSDTTIYDLAVQEDNQRNRISTSSEEIGDTSNEALDNLETGMNNIVLISERRDPVSGDGDQFYREQPQPGCSRQSTETRCQRPIEELENNARRRSDELIRGVEASKARILEPKGNVRAINRHVCDQGHVPQAPHVQPLQRPNLTPPGPCRIILSQDDGYQSEDEDHGQVINNNFQRPNPSDIDQDYLVVGN